MPKPQPTNETIEDAFAYPRDDAAVKSILTQLANDADVSRAILALVAANFSSPNLQVVRPRLTKIVADQGAMRAAQDRARGLGLNALP